MLDVSYTLVDRAFSVGYIDRGEPDALSLICGELKVRSSRLLLLTYFSISENSCSGIWTRNGPIRLCLLFE